MKFDMTGYQDAEGKLTNLNQEDDLGFWESVGDVAFSPIRGIAGAAEGVYDLADWAVGDWLPDADDNFGLGHSKTLLGGLTEGLTQFATGFIPGLGIASKVGKVTGLSAKVAKAGTATQWAAKVGKSATAGALADFTVFDAQEERLSNLIQNYPALENPITEFLAADDDDGEIEGRLKNALEGGILGIGLDGVIGGLKALKVRRNKIANGATKEEAEAAASEEIKNIRPDEQVSEVKPAPGATSEVQDNLPTLDVSRETGQAEVVPPKAEDGSIDADAATKRSKADLAREEPKNVKSVGAAQEVVRRLAENTDESINSLREYTPTSFDEVGIKAEADKNAAWFADAIGMDREKFAQETVKQGTDFVRRQAVLRETADFVTMEADNLFKKVADETITDQELVHLDQLINLSGELLTKAREGGTILGQGLALQRRKAGVDDMPVLKEADEAPVKPEAGNEVPVKPEDGTAKSSRSRYNTKRNQGTSSPKERKLDENGVPITPDKVVPPVGKKKVSRIPETLIITENMYLGDGAAQRGFSKQMLVEAGGGSLAEGRKVMMKRARQWNNVMKAQGRGAALKVAQENASMLQKGASYWMNQILSGPITHAVNILSNSANTLFRPFERAVGTALSTGQFQKATYELMHEYINLGSQFGDALAAARTTFSDQVDTLDTMGKFDTRVTDQIGSTAQGWIGKALNLPSRMLMAEDAFFKHLNYRAQVRGGLFKEAADKKIVGDAASEYVAKKMAAIVDGGQLHTYKKVRLEAERYASRLSSSIGKDEGLSNSIEYRMKQYKDGVRDYMRDNWDENDGIMADAALKYAREMTYTSSLKDPNRAKLVKAAGKWNDIVNDLPALRLITPFVRTPTNLIAFYLDRTLGAAADSIKMAGTSIGKNLPAGKIQEAAQRMSDEMAAGGKTRADVIGRSATGAAMTFTAVTAFSAGNLTGGGPKDKATRDAMIANGWQPYSVKIGDTYYSYKRFDPFATFFGTIADTAELYNDANPEDRESGDAIMGAVLTSFARNITNKTFLMGVAKFTDLLSDPERYVDTFSTQTLASFAPLGAFAQQTFGSGDDMQEVRGWVDAVRAKYGLTGQFTEEYLGLNKLEPKRNIFGEAVPKPDLPYWPAPIYSTYSKDDVIFNEFEQLGHGFRPAPTRMHDIDTTEYRNKRGQTFYDRWQENHGEVRMKGRTMKQAMKELIKSREYQQLPIESLEGNRSPRIDALDRIKRKYRAEAWKKTLQEFPEVARLNVKNEQIKANWRAGRPLSALLEY